MIEFILKGVGIGLFIFAAFEYGLYKGLKEAEDYELDYEDGFADGLEAMYEACKESGAVFLVTDTDEEIVTKGIILK